MLFYAAGSILFLFGLTLALGVLAFNGMQYRHQALAALRTLRLDSAYGNVHAEEAERAADALRAPPVRPLALAHPVLRPAA